MSPKLLQADTLSLASHVSVVAPGEMCHEGVLGTSGSPCNHSSGSAYHSGMGAGLQEHQACAMAARVLKQLVFKTCHVTSAGDEWS